jgi:hypothetical protein
LEQVVEDRRVIYVVGCTSKHALRRPAIIVHSRMRRGLTRVHVRRTHTPLPRCAEHLRETARQALAAKW